MKKCHISCQWRYCFAKISYGYVHHWLDFWRMLLIKSANLYEKKFNFTNCCQIKAEISLYLLHCVNKAGQHLVTRNSTF